MKQIFHILISGPERNAERVEMCVVFISQALRSSYKSVQNFRAIAIISLVLKPLEGVLNTFKGDHGEDFRISALLPQRQLLKNHYSRGNYRCIEKGMRVSCNITGSA